MSRVNGENAPPQPPTPEEFFRTMVTMETVEKSLTRLSQSGDLRGSLHLAQGQEAVPAGACAALNKDDYLTATYRGHGYVLAKGCDLEAVLAEVLGRSTGLCHGYGGKMHLFDASHGLLGTNGIVAGGIGTAVGAALAAKIDGNGRVALTVFGDGAINQGHAHECFNMAAMYKLPAIFLCENNLYAEMTPLERSHGNTNLTERVGSYGIATAQIDGNDPVAVFEVMTEAVSRARTGEGPTFIEAHTYRTIGHYQADPGTAYRTQEEIDEWRSKNPVARYEAMLGEKATAIRNEVEEHVESVIKKVLASPLPTWDVALVGGVK